MVREEIEAEFRRHWRPKFGSIAIDELVFVQELIETHRPARFLEIGMASGLSTGFIARFMDAAGGRDLTSIDHDDTFFGDPSKPNGFLVEAIYPGGAVTTRLIKFKTSLDLGTEGLDGPWEMAFVDANHQHPWPTLDTLALAPHLAGPAIVVHHDLNLYMLQDVMFGIGPKYLHDQFPEARRRVSSACRGNIFCLDLGGLARDRLEEIATRALKLPWSLRGPLRPGQVAKIRAMLETHYSPALCRHFERCLKTMNLDEPEGPVPQRALTDTVR